MARQTFAGDLAAFTATTATVGGVGDVLLLARTVTGITAWTAKTGGTQVTDLQDSGGGTITTVSSDGNGLFEFKGPDTTPETLELWLDTGLGSRQYVGARLATKALATETTAAGAVAKTLVDAKGDLLAGTADNTVARLPAGANNTVLTADSTQTSGMRWGVRSGREFVFSIGTVVAGTGTFRWYNNSGVTLTIVAVRASVGTAPSGGSLVIDVNRDGTTIFSGAKPTITTGTNTTGKLTSMTTTTIADGSYLTVDIDSVPSTPGANLSVQIELSV